MPRLDESRRALLESLADRYGPLPSPGSGAVDLDDRTPFESIAAVALGLAAEPRQATLGLEALRLAGWLEPAALAEVEPFELDEALKQARVRIPAGVLAPLRRLARWASDRAFDADSVANLATESLREAWRGLNGVGPATADAWLLFGLGRPTYPVDRATYRVLVRHGWIDTSADYDEARSVAEGIAPDDPAGLIQLSLGLARLGRDACKPSKAHCDRCPLRPLLPEGGPVEES